MKKYGAIIVGALAIIILLITGIVLAWNKENTPITAYQLSDPFRPLLSIRERTFDFGTMKITETKTKDVVIKNEGKSELVLSEFLTSCDCTFAKVKIGDQMSPEFAMKRTGWRGNLSPGQSAIIILSYKPIIMPVKGSVRREIVFKTNDPANPIVNLKFTAIVK